MTSNEPSDKAEQTPDLLGLVAAVRVLDLTPAEFRVYEADATGARIAELERHPDRVTGDFDFGHLQALHAYILQDIYVWAGQPRQPGQDTTAFGMAHCRPDFLPGEIERVFTAIDRHRPSPENRDAAIATVAEHWGETTALHPFRDGNSRSQRLFFHRYMQSAGWDIDWRQINASAVHAARHVAMRTVDSSYLAAMLAPGVHRPGEAAPGSLAATQGSRDPRSAIALYDAMIEHRSHGRPATTFDPEIALSLTPAERAAQVASRGVARRAPTTETGHTPRPGAGQRGSPPRRDPGRDSDSGRGR